MNKQALKELAQKCTECIKAWKKENWSSPIDIQLGGYIEECRMYGGNGIEDTYQEVLGDAPEDDPEVKKALKELDRWLFELNFEDWDADRIYFGQRIAQLRNERGMTQQELADKTGLSRNHISRIETGQYNVKLDILVSVAKALKMRMDFVSDGDNYDENEE